MGSSPLGPYAPLVAAVTALGIIGAYIVSLFIPTIPVDARTQLGGIALLAIGAVFGSAVAVNGYKAPLSAAHARLDKLQAAVTAAAARAADPTVAPIVATILEDHRPADAGSSFPPADSPPA